MTKKEKYFIYQEISKLSDSQLEDLYYVKLFSVLGSDAERMEELGWEEVDIIERRKYEKYLGEWCDIIEECCLARGIKLFFQSNIIDEGGLS